MLPCVLNLLLSTGRKLSRLPALVCVISVASIIIVFIVCRVLPDNVPGSRSFYNNRLSELSTWPKNQSVILTDYLDLSNSSTFIFQPDPTNVYIYARETSPLCGPFVRVLIMVASSPNNTLARQAIRETWGSKTRLWRKGVRIVFMLGRSENDVFQNSVKTEAERYDDIIQEDFVDTYHNLTLKSMAMLKWVNLTCTKNNNISISPQWILKTDDDMFLNVDRLLEIVQNRINTKLLGCRILGAVPVKNVTSKFYMPRYLYDLPIYPAYLSGTAYLMRGDVVEMILEKGKSVPVIHLEDVYVTGILARHNKIFPESSPFFTYNRVEPEDICGLKKMVTSHQMTPEELKKIWVGINKRPSVPCPVKKAQGSIRIVKAGESRIRKL